MMLPRSCDHGRCSARHVWRYAQRRRRTRVASFDMKARKDRTEKHRHDRETQQQGAPNTKKSRHTERRAPTCGRAARENAKTAHTDTESRRRISITCTLALSHGRLPVVKRVLADEPPDKAVKVDRRWRCRRSPVLLYHV